MTKTVPTSSITNTIDLTSTAIDLTQGAVSVSFPYTISTTDTTTNWSWNAVNTTNTNHADIMIGDRSMVEWMEKVEERLNILTVNPELEAEWNELRELGDRYRELEKKCKEKGEMWKKLKQLPPRD